MPGWAWVTGGVAALLVATGAVWALARLAPVFFGPMFRYEMIRLARRGQQPRLRALLVGLLLAGLLVTYLREFRGQEAASLTGGVVLSQSRMASFGETFLVAFLVAQLTAVVLVTPAAVGGAVTEETERGTLDYLRASLLTDREIILGKLAARLAFVVGVVIAGLPVLMLAMLFGGIDVRVIGAGYGIAGLSTVSLGAYSLYHATTADNLRDVLLRVYGQVGVLTVAGGCCGWVPGVAALSPVSALGYTLLWGVAGRNEPLFWVNFGAFVVVHTIAAVVLIRKAVGRVRVPAIRRTSVPPPPDATPYRRIPRESARGFTVPRINDADPLAWKERYFSGRLSRDDRETFVGCGVALLAAVLFGLGMTAFIGASVEVSQGRWTGEAVNPVMRVVLTGGTMLLGVAIGVRAAAAVTRERQRQTLDGLLVLPWDRSELLRAKWRASLLWARHWFMAMAAVTAVGGVLLAAHPAGLIVAVVQSAAFVVFAATLGLWLSVRCRTAVRSTVFFLTGLMGVWAGPVLLAPLVAVVLRGGGHFVAGTLPTLSLPVGLWSSLMTWREFSEAGRTVPVAQAWLAGLTASVLYAAAVVGMRRDAERVFEQEGRV